MPRAISLTSPHLAIDDTVSFTLNGDLYSGVIKNVIFEFNRPAGWVYSIEYKDTNNITTLIELHENKILYNK